MNQTVNDEQFWQLVDQFIEFANNQCETVDQGDVNAAMLEAAARFNAYTVAATSVDKQQLKEDRDEVVKHLSRQYREMLGENIDDYIANYKSYLGKTNDSSQ